MLNVLDKIETHLNLFIRKGELDDFNAGSVPLNYIKGGESEMNFRPSDSLASTVYIRADS
jgi:hypothetical protein